MEFPGFLEGDRRAQGAGPVGAFRAGVPQAGISGIPAGRWQPWVVFAHPDALLDRSIDLREASMRNVP
jgi:hypothetical protein